MTPRPIAELLAEAKRLDAEIDRYLPGEVKADAWRAKERFARVNFDRFLAIAEAAVEMRELARHRGCCANYRGGTCDCGLAAFDRLAAPDDEREGR